MSDAPEQPSGRSLGSAYFLGVVAVGFVILLWMRGLGRFLVPLLVIGGAVYAVYRFVKLVRAPVD